MKKMYVWDVANIIFLLLMAVTVCLSFSPNIMARFSTASAGSDSARVAKFDVQVTSAKDTLSMDFFDESISDAFKITVSNNSEVGVNYKIEIRFEKSVPSFLSLELDGRTDHMTVNDTRTIYTFDGFSFGATGTRTTEHILTVKLDSSLKDATPDQFIQNDISVIVKAEQIN